LLEGAIQIDVDLAAFRGLRKRLTDRAGVALWHREIDARAVILIVAGMIPEVAAASGRLIDQMPTARVRDALIVIFDAHSVGAGVGVGVGVASSTSI
jgi:hypothetical protein